MSAVRPRVCILTSGVGSRMGSYSQVTNKALLPLGGKAILSHILEKFPRDTEYVISLGHKADDVRAYLELAHPDRHFHFVTIDNITGPGSGPGHSLSQCRPALPGAFYFVSCDTLWSEPFDLLPAQHDWFASAPVPEHESPHYCNFILQGNVITDLRDKQKVASDLGRAFTGLCYIHHYEAFWRGLGSDELVQSEKQISSGIRELIRLGSAESRPMQWIDVGSEAHYRRAQTQMSGDFDFSKTDEFVYIVDSRVIKFFRHHDVATKRAARAKLKPEVFPKMVGERPGWYAYELAPGQTLYEHNDIVTFMRLLTWLKQNLWQVQKVDRQVTQKAGLEFYRDKTLQRIAAFRKKHNVTDREVHINGEKCAPLESLLAQVPWEILSEIIPVFFHGDLQFDNILIEPSSGRFCLLDWRQDFAGQIEFGDLHYDFAKLYGGIVMNYDLIKRGLFTYRESGDHIFFDFAQRASRDQLLAHLKQFIRDNGQDDRRVELLVALIFLNMSPLHHEPWDRLLFALGRTRLQTALAHIK